ncbi:hypothetical protein NMY22_g1358 [Coprinellus aureogranulatus]|nr:hypothetical protein NMY22_g1358 [Coprinellus aureogranulatus]
MVYSSEQEGIAGSQSPRGMGQPKESVRTLKDPHRQHPVDHWLGAINRLPSLPLPQHPLTRTQVHHPRGVSSLRGELAICFHRPQRPAGCMLRAGYNLKSAPPGAHVRHFRLARRIQIDGAAES